MSQTIAYRAASTLAGTTIASSTSIGLRRAGPIPMSRIRLASSPSARPATMRPLWRAQDAAEQERAGHGVFERILVLLRYGGMFVTPL